MVFYFHICNLHITVNISTAEIKPMATASCGHGINNGNAVWLCVAGVHTAVIVITSQVSSSTDVSDQSHINILQRPYSHSKLTGLPCVSP